MSNYIFVIFLAAQYYDNIDCFQQTHAKLRAQLLQCQWTDEKTKQVQKMNEREADTYEQLFERIRSEIEQAEKEIFETKIELEQARKIRRNRMEYDAMAKVSCIYILVLYSARIKLPSASAIIR